MRFNVLVERSTFAVKHRQKLEKYGIVSKFLTSNLNFLYYSTNDSDSNVDKNFDAVAEYIRWID